MFVYTPPHSLINLNSHLRVAVIESESNGRWQLTVYTEADRTGFSGSTAMPEYPFADFSEEVEARYAFCHLYSSLEAGKSVWDPRGVESFSDLWNKAKQELSNENKADSRVELQVLETFELKITGLREITIHNTCGDSRSDRTKKDIVEEKIKNTFESADPIDETAWKINWKDIP